MSKVYFKVPSVDEMTYRQKLMMDKDTMEYNAGYDIDVKGYDYSTGTIKRTLKELKEDWYEKWVNKEPERYFAYIYVGNEPVGEIYYYPNGDTTGMGIIIEAKHRGKGYSFDALMELERIAFEKNGISELTDLVPDYRIAAQKIFKKAGFIKTDKTEEYIRFGEKEIVSQLLITKEMYFKNKRR